MLELMILVALKAGKKILKVYCEKKVNCLGRKNDLSPVTNIDLISNDIIITSLQKLTPGIPILSEEEFSLWSHGDMSYFWVIDPLDGTKEFLSYNREFTVNIALVERGIPIMGVVYAPAMGVLYAGMNYTAWKMDVSTRYRVRIRVKKLYPPIVLISRFHDNDYKKLNCYLMNLTHYRVVIVGSSLKFCLIAEGIAQIYPRFSPVSIWDIAAGHAIAAASGAVVNNWNGCLLNYKNVQLPFLYSGFHVFVSCVFSMFVCIRMNMFIDC